MCSGHARQMELVSAYIKVLHEESREQSPNFRVQGKPCPLRLSQKKNTRNERAWCNHFFQQKLSKIETKIFTVEIASSRAKDVHTIATKVATCGRELPFGLCQAALRSDTQSITQ